MQFENMSLALTNKPSESDEKEREETSHGFEGAEKRLTLLFEGIGDLRCIPTSKWVIILKNARCDILNTIKNNECIAHLLSESSLFIFKHKLMIKTCGTTTLLRIIPIIIKESHKIQLMIDDVFYSRSNFMFPQNQPILHRSFDHEIMYLNEYFEGDGIVLGSLNKARWHCFQSNNNHKYVNNNNKTLEIVLFDLDKECMKYYFKQNMNDIDTDLDQFIMNGCCIPHKAMIDSYAFDPCGYSLNAILEKNYWTIHITPEKEASFVSFETNYDYINYKDVIQKVISFFAPKRFSFAINAYRDDVDCNKEMDINVFDGFMVCNASDYKFSLYHDIMWSNYSKKRMNLTDKRRLDVKDEPRSLWKFIHNNIVQRNYSKSMSYLFACVGRVDVDYS